LGGSRNFYKRPESLHWMSWNHARIGNWRGIRKEPVRDTEDWDYITDSLSEGSRFRNKSLCEEIRSRRRTVPVNEAWTRDVDQQLRES
jgi:hypothetical protein